MDCKTALALLESYLDGELDRADARDLEAHVDRCADCRPALTRLDELRAALRDQGLRYTAPQELRDRLRSTDLGAVASGTLTSRRPRPAASNWLRYAAACVLAFGAGGVSVHLWNSGQTTANARSQLTRDLFASHWRALAAASPVDIVSTDRHTVKPWFAGKLATAPLVQDFAEQGFPLVGGRLDYVGSERVAVLVYRHGQHTIDVFVLPQEPMAQIAEPVQYDGYGIRGTVLGTQSAAIVSDLDEQELGKFQRLLDGAK
ncbi:MAG: zf-HC2 domain-containing protein [Rudaea sp.]|nr:zf-HC2 domain-containing protein [Rudaea sp.]